MPLRFSCFLFLMLIILTSCYKTTATSLTVEVTDSSGSLISGAIVKLKADPTQNISENEVLIDYEEATNSAGIAFFTLSDIYKAGQSGAAIVNVIVHKDGFTAEGIMELIGDYDNRIDIVLQ